MTFSLSKLATRAATHTYTQPFNPQPPHAQKDQVGKCVDMHNNWG